MVQAGLHILQEREAELDLIADKIRSIVEEVLSGHLGVPFDAKVIIKRGKECFVSEQRLS